MIACDGCGSFSSASCSFCSNCGRPLVPRYEPNSVKNVEYVGFVDRFLAAFIDGIVLFIFQFPFIFEGFALSFAVPFVYFVAFWATKQRTPGYMVISARIIDETTGRAPSAGQCLVRFLMKGFLAVLTLGIFYFFISCDPKKQAWHDHIAGTAVIKQNGSVHNNEVFENQPGSKPQQPRQSDLELFFDVYSFEDPSRAHEIWMELPLRSRQTIARCNPEAADVMIDADRQLKDIEEEFVAGHD